MKIAVMQPTYLPWLGYLDMMDQADLFIVLDDVQFSRQSWQQRNRIRSPSGLDWLTVPVLGGGPHRINDAPLADVSFAEHHLEKLSNCYRDSPRLGATISDLRLAYQRGLNSGLLIDVNLDLIELLRSYFGITTRTVRSSDLVPSDGRIERLLSLCQNAAATEYLTPPGSVAYLERSISEFDRIQVALQVHLYDHPHYQQFFDPFIPHASSIDLVLASKPEESGDILRSGRLQPVPLNHWSDGD